MLYRSLNGDPNLVTFSQATRQGLAPDGGLYFPEQIPLLPPNFVNQLPQLSNAEIAYQVMKPYVGNCIEPAQLKKIVEETIDFDIPLKPIHPQAYSLELFHGPTLAFKDVGARFMSRCLSYFTNSNQQNIVLVATSGDTGGAVAAGFYKVPNVKVVLLYPANKVSAIQEKQLTSFGQNIEALKINGSFDDCQTMVKTAFNDISLSKQLNLTSANSINVARWLPQQIYYFLAIKQWQQPSAPVMAIPSGNFGNICAGLLAHRSGLPIRHFIAACNANNAVTEALEKHRFTAKPTIATLSNAMDVGNPSNFKRILALFDNRYENLQPILSSESISDQQTIHTIQTVLKKYNYLLDPHGAVAYTALQNYLNDKPQEKGIFLETAHPIKFNQVLESILNKPLPIPAAIQTLLAQSSHFKTLSPDYDSLKSYLLTNHT